MTADAIGRLDRNDADSCRDAERGRWTI